MECCNTIMYYSVVQMVHICEKGSLVQDLTPITSTVEGRY